MPTRCVERQHECLSPARSISPISSCRISFERGSSRSCQRYGWYPMIRQMSESRAPVRQLSRFERLKARFGVCPTCGSRLEAPAENQAISWTRSNSGYGNSSQQSANTGNQMPAMTHVELRKSKTHCSKCGYTYVHGWIYSDATDA